MKPDVHFRRVAIVQRELPHYRTPFYECLRAELASRDVALAVIQSSASASERLPGDIGNVPWAHTVSGSEFGIGDRRVLWQPLIPTIKTADLVIVEQASRLLLNYVLFARQALLRRPMALWGHGRSFHSENATTGAGESLKRWLSARVHWWFAYNDLSAKVISELGFPVERTTVVQNSTDTRRFREMVDETSAERLYRLREGLGLHRGRTAIFVGNFHPEKQLSFLFEAIEHLHREDPDF